MSKGLVLTAWIAAVAGLVAASLTPSLAPPAAYRADLAVHTGVYLALAAMPMVLLQRLPLGLLLGALLALAGLAIEVAQSFVPGRSGSALDLLANWLGVALGLALGWALGWMAMRLLGR